MITIKKLTTKKELTEFVTFPFRLNKNSKTWIPPIISEEVKSFSAEHNPVFENAQADFYLAYNSDNQPVGRIAVIVNNYEVKVQNIKKVRFGWFDVIDDIKVTEALLEKAFEKARELSLLYIEGPMGFSNLDKVGVQTAGFEYIGGMMTWTNPPYYQKHFEALGMVKEKGYVETFFPLKSVDYQSYKRAGDMIERRYNLSMAPIKTNKDILPYVDEMFDLFNETYAKLSSFIPISPKQKQFFKEKYIPFVDPEFIKFILDADGKIISFAIVLPSFSEALQKAKGKLFPFGFWHLLKAKRNPKVVEFYLIGIAPEYQTKGVPAMLFREYYEVFERKGVEKCIVTPELEDNIAVQRLWKNFNPTDFMKRATYRKEVF